MRTKNLTIVALALMALITTTGAFATITCGPPNDLGGGNVEQTVTSNAISGIIGIGGPPIVVGNVTFSPGTCTSPGLSSCTWSAQGDPGGALPQSATVDFFDADGNQDCVITDYDGLPVELIEFSVE